jgi:hypothetical protein
MKKACLLAGFFILAGSSQSFGSYTQTDTLPTKKWPQSPVVSTADFRSSFYRWRTSGNGDTYSINLSSNLVLMPVYKSSFQFNWWPQTTEQNGKQVIRLNTLSGFLQGVSTGFSATNNYYFKNAYDLEINKSFYSISSFLIGAGVGTVLGLKNPRRFPY